MFQGLLPHLFCNNLNKLHIESCLLLEDLMSPGPPWCLTDVLDYDAHQPQRCSSQHLGQHDRLWRPALKGNLYFSINFHGRDAKMQFCLRWSGQSGPSKLVLQYRLAFWSPRGNWKTDCLSAFHLSALLGSGERMEGRVFKTNECIQLRYCCLPHRFSVSFSFSSEWAWTDHDYQRLAQSSKHPVDT